MEQLAEYAGGGYETVEGLMQSGASTVIWSLIELQDAFNVTGNVAEIGVYQGRTLILLCHALNAGEKGFAFDCFGIPTGTNEEWPQKLGENLKSFGLDDGCVDVFTVDSTSIEPNALKEMISATDIRLFSIDGDHGVSAVQHDLKLAQATLSEGGLIIADDLFNPWYPTVTEALYYFFKEEPGDLEPIAMICANGPVETGASKLVIGRASHAKKYKAGLKILNRDDLKHCDAFAGYLDVPTFYFAGLPQKRILDETNLSILNDILAK